MHIFLQQQYKMSHRGLATLLKNVLKYRCHSLRTLRLLKLRKFEMQLILLLSRKEPPGGQNLLYDPTTNLSLVSLSYSSLFIWKEYTLQVGCVWGNAADLLVTGKFALKLQMESILWSFFAIVGGKWELRFHGHKLSNRLTGRKILKLLLKYL